MEQENKQNTLFMVSNHFVILNYTIKLDQNYFSIKNSYTLYN